jgi:crotonobetainyl-CoA:carnitine CoA-transferase CaiB-like acyl-CoA transferase
VRPRPGPGAAGGLRLAERRERHAAIDTALAAWLRPQPAASAAANLTRAGIPAAALASSRDLVDSDHLKERGFWDPHNASVLPGLPWRASFGRTIAPAPALGADTDAILREVLNLSPAEIAALREAGALG